MRTLEDLDDALSVSSGSPYCRSSITLNRVEGVRVIEVCEGARQIRARIGILRCADWSFWGGTDRGGSGVRVGTCQAAVPHDVAAFKLLPASIIPVTLVAYREAKPCPASATLEVK